MHCAIINFYLLENFQSDYFNHMDLHIGLTTSTGGIVEFDRCGLRRHSSGNNHHYHHHNQRRTSDSRHQQERTTNGASNGGTGGGKWGQSLLVERVPEEWSEHWDETLQEVSIFIVVTPNYSLFSLFVVCL